MKVLLYENRKIDPLVWDATEDKQPQAFLALFRYLDEDWSCYADLKTELSDGVPGKQARFYESALSGDAHSARRLLASRRGYEYQYWTLVDVADPGAV